MRDKETVRIWSAKQREKQEIVEAKRLLRAMRNKVEEEKKNDNN